jgi:hypothetical protein
MFVVVGESHVACGPVPATRVQPWKGQEVWNIPFAIWIDAILKFKSIRKQSKTESILVESRWLDQDE